MIHVETQPRDDRAADDLAVSHRVVDDRTAHRFVRPVVTPLARVWGDRPLPQLGRWHNDA